MGPKDVLEPVGVATCIARTNVSNMILCKLESSYYLLGVRG